jgi:hypothetical protein
MATPEMAVNFCSHLTTPFDTPYHTPLLFPTGNSTEVASAARPQVQQVTQLSTIDYQADSTSKIKAK